MNTGLGSRCTFMDLGLSSPFYHTPLYARDSFYLVSFEFRVSIYSKVGIETQITDPTPFTIPLQRHKSPTLIRIF